MLPTNVFQIDYQDLGNLIWNDLSSILDYENKNLLKFDLVLAKLKNGTFPGSIVSNSLNIPMATIKVVVDDIELFVSKENVEIKNILLVDCIYKDNELDLIKEKLLNQIPNANIVTYCPLVYSETIKKPDIYGLVSNHYFMPPWNWNTFTSQTHLERLLNNNNESFNKNTHTLGFCSKKSFNDIELLIGQQLKNEWIEIFDFSNKKINTTSNISSLENNLEHSSIEELKTKKKNFLEEKTNFIKTNGITHFIETDFNQALIISELCPTVHILYLKEKYLFKIYSKEFDKNKLINLNF